MISIVTSICCADIRLVSCASNAGGCGAVCTRTFVLEKQMTNVYHRLFAKKDTSFKDFFLNYQFKVLYQCVRKRKHIALPKIRPYSTTLGKKKGGKKGKKDNLMKTKPKKSG